MDNSGEFASLDGMVPCEVTGKWVPEDQTIILQGKRVGAEGKKILLDCLASGELLEGTLTKGRHFMLARRLGVLSVGKMLGCVYALIGLIAGAIISLISLIGVAGGGPAESILFGAGAIIMLPIFYGGIGFIGGVFLAAIFNVVASIAGGIEIEFDYRGRD